MLVIWLVLFIDQSSQVKGDLERLNDCPLMGLLWRQEDLGLQAHTCRSEFIVLESVSSVANKMREALINGPLRIKSAYSGGRSFEFSGMKSIKILKCTNSSQLTLLLLLFVNSSFESEVQGIDFY